MKKILLIIYVATVSCNNSLDTDVNAAMQEYDKLILHVDAKGIANMFTPDGVLAQPGGMSVTGRDSIEKFLGQFKYIKVEAQKSITDSIHKINNIAYQYGKYYQRAVINNKTYEVHGMFQANWFIKFDGKLMLKRMSAWPTDNK